MELFMNQFNIMYIFAASHFRDLTRIIVEGVCMLFFDYSELNYKYTIQIIFKGYELDGN